MREQSVAAERPEWFKPSIDTPLDASHAAGQLETLPIEQREVIVARIWGGLSFEEIGDLTKTSRSDCPSEISIGHRCAPQEHVVNWRSSIVNRENEDLSDRRPEIAAVEAALAQLRPRRERASPTK